MHGHSIERWQHRHVFLGRAHARNERRIWLVVALTAVMMVAEIAAGAIFGSMALMADGWHMSTHAAALAISAFAYRFARKHADDARFSFGTGKAGELAAFASAIILGLVAIGIAFESAVRIFSPIPIRFDEALIVAVIGLAVNLASAWLLMDRDADHDHDHSHAHGHHHHDSNIRAAYLHVIADALTSVLAIVALLVGRLQGWLWLDPVIGIVGAVIIAQWSFGLLRSAGAVLLDMVPDNDLVARLTKKSRDRRRPRRRPACLAARARAYRRHRVHCQRSPRGAGRLQGAARGLRRTLPCQHRGAAVRAGNGALDRGLRRKSRFVNET